MKWTIFYEDGSCFSSDDGESKDSPCDKGVLLITQSTSHWKVKGGDWYTWDFKAKEWFGRSDAGQGNYISKNKVQIIRYGVPIESKIFDMLDNHISKTPSFRHRSESEPWMNRKGELAWD